MYYNLLTHTKFVKTGQNNGPLHNDVHTSLRAFRV